MPAFAHDNGGPLSSEQVKILTTGIKKHWGPPASPSGTLPAYTGLATAGGANKNEGIRVFPAPVPDATVLTGRATRMATPCVAGRSTTRRSWHSSATRRYAASSSRGGPILGCRLTRAQPAGRRIFALDLSGD